MSLTFVFNVISVAYNFQPAQLTGNGHRVCCHQNPVFCTCCILTDKQRKKATRIVWIHTVAEVQHTILKKSCALQIHLPGMSRRLEQLTKQSSIL